MDGTPQASPLLNAVCGLIPLVVYILFALLVTRQQNFYVARRWKAAVFLTVFLYLAIFSFLSATLLVFAILGFFQNPSLLCEISFLDVLNHASGWMTIVLTISVVFTPLMFLTTFCIYYRLKFVDLNSDDWLDRIWKDPNRNKRSPIQWL